MGGANQATDRGAAVRRASIARDLAAHVSGAVTAHAACMFAAEALRQYPEDVPFALFYLVDPVRRNALLAGVSGLEPGGSESPYSIPLDNGDERWPITQVSRTGELQISGGAAVVPLRSREAHDTYGCAIFALNGGARLDHAHREFLELLAGNLSTAIGHVQSQGAASTGPGDLPGDPATDSSLPRTSPLERVVLLIVEDNRADVFLIERAIEFHHIPAQVVIARDGEEAIKYLERASADTNVPCPGALLVDLNLPKRSGIEILEAVRSLPRCSHLPVIIVTSSDSKKDREKSEELGATRYFRKPSSYQEFLDLGEVLKDVLQKAKESL